AGGACAVTMPRCLGPLLAAAALTLAAVSLRGETVTVAWDASPSEGVIAYRVYRNGVLQGETGGLLWALAVEPGQTYTIGVTAIDSVAESVPAILTYTVPVPLPSCTTGQFLAEYFATMTLSGPVVAAGCTNAIAYDWGAGAPSSSVPVDQFSARWTGVFDLAGGPTTFRVTADDGVRLVVDGAVLIDAWWDQGATTYTAVRDLPAGLHAVRLEFYEHTGAAVAQLSWVVVPPTPPPPPPPPDTCTLDGATYQIGQRATIQLRRAQVSSWLGLHPEWQFISSRPRNRTWTSVTVECQP
ncbi:MAG: PA14 domain-containing protein, partial [Gammaproteobacteria bacterium]